MEEQKRTSNLVALSFNLMISTKPNVARYVTTGIVTLEGKLQDINKRLEINPKTQVPQILFTVYQHVFNSIYLLSSILNTPYPPPDLLHPMQEKIQILPQSTETGSSQPANAKPAETTQSTKTEAQEKTAKEPATSEKTAATSQASGVENPPNARTAAT